MAYTAGDIITAAFIKVGVDSPTAAQTASALISLNNMVSLLGVDLPAASVVRESFAMVIADPEYTVGSGGQWDTVRPNAINSCYLRDAENYDYPVTVISSKKYDRLSNKTFSARPTELVFVPEYPLTRIIFNAAPDIAYNAYFEFVKSFVEFATTATSVSLPNEYKEFFTYNLAVSLGEDWGRAVSSTIYAQATRTREIIERLMAAQRPAPTARFEFGGMGSGNNSNVTDGSYSIANDGLIDGGSF